MTVNATTASTRETEAMRRALALAATPGVPLGPNPRVGCVLLAPDGEVVAEGYHHGAGTPHAEIEALRLAGARARGATAVVTLEPCDHTGRTSPCSVALLQAGVIRVVHAQSDPNPVAAGGARRLVAGGVEVVGGVLADEAEALNPLWAFAVTHGRPFVTWKAAGTLDGRVAANDGSSRWITSPESRAEVHVLRSQVDAVMVGIGTVLEDDAHLAARSHGIVLPRERQPLRVVVGRRDIPERARVLDSAAPSLQIREHDPSAILAVLHRRDVQHVLLEGGPTLAAAFIRAGLVDAVRWYVAPVLLGAGAQALGSVGINSISDALRLEITDVARVGDDVRIDARTLRAGKED
jgi:diaminohydroxyphosphoribosylaminopyrimidine deaminase/5-amino-6-(5-phosphoribosylamino)uracil reductase